MKASPPIAVHRILEWCAVLHAVLLSLLVLLWAYHYGSMSWLQNDLWVDFATLWLLWPLVLTLHPGRSLLRVTVPVIVALLVLLPSVREYRSMAPHAFGLPEGVHLSSHGIVDYFAARRVGHVEAEKDLRSGVLVVETYGFPMPLEYGEILRQRYQIELKSIAGDTDVTERVIGHAKGYNEISEPEIKRRFGDHVLEGAADEALKHWREQSTK